MLLFQLAQRFRRRRSARCHFALHHALAQLARHVVEHGNHHDDQQQRHADLIVAVEFNVGHQFRPMPPAPTSPKMVD